MSYNICIMYNELNINETRDTIFEFYLTSYGIVYIDVHWIKASCLDTRNELHHHWDSERKHWKQYML